MFIKQFSCFARTTNIFSPVRRGKTEISAQSVPHLITIYKHRLLPFVPELPLQFPCDGTLACSRYPCKPEYLCCMAISLLTLFSGNLPLFSYNLRVRFLNRCCLFSSCRDCRSGANHPCADCHVGIGIYNDETAGLLIDLIVIKKEWMRGLQPRLSNFIQLQDVCVFPGNGIYIHPVNQFFDEDLGCLSGVHDQISLIQLHRLLIHPAEVSLKLILNDWNIILPDNHVATAYIDLILQGKCDGISRHRFLQVSILRYDLLDPAAHSGRQGEDLLSRLDSPRCHPSGKSSEVLVGPNDILDRKTEINNVM